MKLCWDCKHFRYYDGCRGYSELTPGWSMEINCAKKHWEFNQWETTEEEFKAYLTMAETCSDYERQE